jgi:hypothetical protein
MIDDDPYLAPAYQRQHLTSDSGGILHGIASNIYKNAEARSSGVGSR